MPALPVAVSVAEFPLQMLVEDTLMVGDVLTETVATAVPVPQALVPLTV